MKRPEEIKKGLEMCGVIRGRCKECPYYGEAECVPNLSADALAHIQQLEAQVPKWISVEERLPEPETEVLVWCGKFVRMACYGHTKSSGLIFWDYDCEGYQDELYPQVTHWMPLPEPPKEG